LCQAGWLTPVLAGSRPGQLRAAHGILKAALGGPLSLAVRQRASVSSDRRAQQRRHGEWGIAFSTIRTARESPPNHLQP